MFCPKCSAYLMEKDLIKTNVKYAPGNVAIEYEAQCPSCHVDMGRVSWGQLTANPDIERELAKEKEAVAARRAANEAALVGEEAASRQPSKSCPHCGKLLPTGY